MLLKNTALLFSILTFVLMGCSGGSSGGNTNGDSGNPEANQDAQSDLAFTTLPAADQPNTVSPDIAIDSTGNYHSVYSDIDGRLFYGFCSGDCSSAGNWRSVQISTFELSSTGSITAKLLLDNSEQLHVAVAVNTGGSGIFSSQPIYYANCSTTCTDVESWSIGQVALLTRSVLQQEAQTIDWFALTTDGRPRLSFVEPVSELGDEFLWYFICDANCTLDSNWTRTEVAELNIASSTPAHLHIGDDNMPHIIVSYQVIGASITRLMYIACLSLCETDSPVWDSPLELLQYDDNLLAVNAISATLINNSPIIALYQTVDDDVELSLLRCDSNCSSLSGWQQDVFGDDLPMPPSVVSLSPVIDVLSDNGVLHLGLIGKDRSVSSVNRVMRFTCAGVCSDDQWSYQELADTSSLEFDDQGICLFIGTAARSPLVLLPRAFSFEVVPQWGCGTGPVEITDGDGNVFIDNNADIRFFEIAAFGVSN